MSVRIVGRYSARCDGSSVVGEMNYEREIELLESEWLPDVGFFWKIRNGHFDPADFERAFQKIASVSIETDAAVPRRLVSLLWYVPLFMEWQKERVKEKSGDSAQYLKAISAMRNKIERLLGVP